MAEYSYPVEEQPMPSQYWTSVTLGVGDGILDEGGSPYWITGYDNATNTANLRVSTTQGTANAILKGFYHKLDEAVTLSIPAVTTATTYWIALQFDPVRVDERGVPVRLGVFTTLDRTGGKSYVILYRIVRQPNQLLTDAAVTIYRQRVAPTLTVYSRDRLPDPSTVLWGTLAATYGPERSIYVCMSDGATDPMRWERITGSDPWETLTLVNGRAPAAEGWAPAIQREGKRRRLRGGVARTLGDGKIDPAQGHNNLVMLTLPEGDRPDQWLTVIGATSLGSPLAFARIGVGPDGVLAVTTSEAVSWVSLDGISWEVP